MAATLAQIRAGLKANLDAVYTDPWTVNSYMPTSPNPPAIDIQPAHPVSIEYDNTMGRHGDYLYVIVRAITQTGTDADWQTLLDTLMDPTSSTSIKAAIEADKTLGGVVSWARVTRCSGYHSYSVKGALEPVMGLEFTVEVMT